MLLAPPRPVFVGAMRAGRGRAVAWWVTHRTLGDRPLSIDSGIYLLQARAMAHGHFGMPEPLPAQAFADRFVLEGPDARLYGVFPPGWPLALVPFVWLGRPMLAGPAVAVAMVFAQAWLGRALVGGLRGDVDSGELATRASLLLSLPSAARALETADLLSHAFVALLACVALAVVLDPSRRLRTAGLVAGACVGWALAARLLDGGWFSARPWSACSCWRPWARFAAAPAVDRSGSGAVRAAPGARAARRDGSVARADADGLLPALRLAAHVPQARLRRRRGVHGGAPDARRAHGQPGVRTGSQPGRSRWCASRRSPSARSCWGSRRWSSWPFVPLIVGAAGAADVVAVAFFLALTLAYGLFYGYGTARFFGARRPLPGGPVPCGCSWARGAARLPARAHAAWPG